MAMLAITPNELTFKFELRKPIPSTITLKNPTSQPIAFKVKTTSPKAYAVKPNTGIVAPETSVEVKIIMQAQREMPDFNNIKDKFLVQSCTAKPGEEVTSEMFKKDKGVQETRLRVVFVKPAAPPSPVPEETVDSQYDSRSPGVGHGQGTSAVTSGGDSRTTSQVSDWRNQGPGGDEKLFEKMRIDRDEAIMKVKSLEAELTSIKSSQNMMNKAGVAGFTLIHLLLTSIICFLLGRYT